MQNIEFHFTQGGFHPRAHLDKFLSGVLDSKETRLSSARFLP